MDWFEKLTGFRKSGYEVTRSRLEVVGALVSQAFCSALPVSYSSNPARRWRAFAILVLEGAYEASLWAATLNAQRSSSDVVFLTQVGGGAFGNDDSWVLGARRRALELIKDIGLDVRLVSRGPPSAELVRLAHEY